MDLLTSIPGWNLLMPTVAIVVFSTIHLIVDRSRDLARTIEVVLLYAIGITGFNGLVGFVAHTAFADTVAESIGWASGNPFQREVAGANLAIGVVGFAGFWRRDFWLPFLVAKALFAWTAGAVHVLDIVEHGNFAPNNAGPILVWDFLLPLALLVMYAVMRRSRGPELQGAIPIRPLAAAPARATLSVGASSEVPSRVRGIR
jgi:uncharacterized membrane protein YhaH (DUF805 family)